MLNMSRISSLIAADWRADDGPTVAVTMENVMAVLKYRILEETSVFADGSRRLEFALQAQNESHPKQWDTLGISSTLIDARKALLFLVPSSGCGHG
jgi:hypothetical protein